MVSRLFGTVAGLAVLVCAGQAAAQAGPVLMIRDAAVRVVVTPEARNTITATLSGGSGRLQRPTVRAEGANLVVDGGLHDRIRGCGSFSFSFFGHRRGGDEERRGDAVRPNPRERVRIEGVGSVSLNELPLLDVRVPLDARVEAGGAVFGTVGRSRSVNLSTAGCGDWSVANTEGRLTVSQQGSGDVRAGATAGVDSHIRGSGNLEVAEVNGPLSVDISGSGDFSARRADGPMRTGIAGSGDVRIDDGVARGLNVEVRGSGDVDVAAAEGEVRLSTHGSGDISVARGRASMVSVEVRGSGDVSFGGDAGTASVDIAGSGDVDLGRVSGPVNRSVHGSGDLTVNGRSVEQ